jgi:hypothetical protein
MDKTAESSSILMSNVIYMIFIAIFISLLFLSISKLKNNTEYWESFYAKEIAKIIDSSKPGDLITIDVQTASRVAKKNGLASVRDIVRFDSKNHEVIVQLSDKKETRFAYFSDYKILDYKIELGKSNSGGNLLVFQIAKEDLISGERNGN